MSSPSPPKSPTPQNNPSIYLYNNPITPKFKFTILCTCTFLLCLIILINAIYQTPLFIQGINFIYGYQQAQPYNLFHFIQNIFSVVCNPTALSTVMVIYYIVSKRKLMLLVHFSYFFIGVYIIALLKQAFQQSRPIWISDKIQKWQWFCPKDFGNPSGHSFAVAMLYQPIFSDSIGYGKYRIWGFLLVLLCIMVPISRMYLGVHSSNQILFGLALGLIFLNLYKYIYQKYLYILFWNMVTNRHKYRKLIIIIVFHIVSLILPIVIKDINSNARPMIQSDLDNLNIRCGTHLTGNDVQVHMMLSCSIVNFGFGILYGFVLLLNTPNYRKYLLGLWVFQNKKKMYTKIIVYIVCAVAPAYTFKILANIFQVYQIINYIYLSLAYLSFGLGLAYLAPISTQKLKLMKFSSGGTTQDYQEKLETFH